MKQPIEAILCLSLALSLSPSSTHLEAWLESLGRRLLRGHVVQAGVLVLHLDDGAAASIEALSQGKLLVVMLVLVVLVLQSRLRRRGAVGRVNLKATARCASSSASSAGGEQKVEAVGSCCRYAIGEGRVGGA